jgi:small nuclear ribonucleoprotein (snRNP)-like protein
MTIELSQYVGKKIVVELIDGSVLAGEVEYTINESWHSELYPYSIDGWLFNEYGYGMTKPRIVKIRTSFDGSGIAQKAPNINLEDFVGQKVYVKLARGSEHITNVTSTYNLSEVGQYNKNGTSASGNEHWAILEIYGKDAYEINTKSTFDNPNDYQIEQAKQLLSQMSEEQIAKLLKSLK